MEKNMDKNFSQFSGLPVPRLIIKFAVPTILSQLVTLIYNLADTYFVGQTNDPSQVAALTLSFPLFMSMTMVSNLFGIGANSYMSRSLGGGQPEQAKKASTFSFYGGIAGILAIMAVLFIFMEPILHGIGAKTQETFEATEAYLTWTVIYGGVPTVSAMVLAHLIRAEGNTKQASIGIMLGGLLNIALDFVFVSIFGLGAEGAAIATCISNVVAFLYLLSVVLRNKDTVVRLNPVNISFNPVMVKQVIFVGLPAAAVIILGASANIVLTNQISVYGDTSIAAFGIVQKFGTVVVQITVGLTQGIMPLLGYYYGAGDILKVKGINRWSFGILGIYAVFCLSVVEIFTGPLVMLFIDEAVTVEKAIVFARIWMLSAPGLCFTNLLCSIFQAMGKWRESLAISLLRQGVLLIPLLIILNRWIGELGLVASQPIADTITLFMGFLLYAKTVRKTEVKR